MTDKQINKMIDRLANENFMKHFSPASMPSETCRLFYRAAFEDGFRMAMEFCRQDKVEGEPRINPIFIKEHL